MSCELSLFSTQAVKWCKNPRFDHSQECGVFSFVSQSVLWCFLDWNRFVACSWFYQFCCSFCMHKV